MRHDFLKAFARFFYCFRTIYILLSHNGSILQVGRWPPCHVLPEIIYFASKPLIHQAQFLQVLLKVVFINGIVLQRRAIVVYRLWRVRQYARNLRTFSNAQTYQGSYAHGGVNSFSSLSCICASGTSKVFSSVINEG